MRRSLCSFLGVAFALCALPTLSLAEDLYTEHYGKFDLHLDHYWQAPLHGDSHDDFGAFDLEPGLLVEWDNVQLVMEPRLSSGGSGAGRVDPAQVNIQASNAHYDLLVGTNIEFWGKVESFNPVDIINSYDYTRGLTRGQKLGAPMVKLSTPIGPGQLDIYALPQFVENIYPGSASRLRVGAAVHSDAVSYSGGANHGDMGRALRWSGYFGDVDLAVSHFSGIGRDGRFLPQSDGRLKADYSRITQNGIDVQYLRGDTALKAEVIRRTGQYDRLGKMGSYEAGIIGVEHNLYDLAGTGYDVVLLAEFASDSRKLDSHTGFQKDLIGGARLLFNDVDDSEALLLVTRDLDYNATTTRLSYSTRVTDNLVIKAAASSNNGLEKDANNAIFANDQYAGVTLSYSY